MRNRILFADSSSTIQQVAEMAFENENISVTVTGSGEEALSMLEEITPDLIVADEELPGISGIELCKKIKESGIYSLIPFLMLKKNEAIPTDSETPAPDDFLLKPFKSEELVAKAKALINITKSCNDGIPDIPEGDDILAGLDEEEEMSLYETEEVISLTGREELPAGLNGEENHAAELEISSIEEDIPEEDMDLSGLLSAEEIEAGMEKIEKRNSELDEIFGFENGLDENLSQGKDDEADPEEFFKEKRSAFAPPSALPAAELDELINSSIKKSLEDINGKIIKEELREYLQTLTPGIMKTIEKAIWEIMPDLAESLLKKEIEKIKNE